MMILTVLFIICTAVIANTFNFFFDDAIPPNCATSVGIAGSQIAYFLNISITINVKVEWVSLPTSAIASTTIPFSCQDPHHIFLMLPPALYIQKYGNTGSCTSYTSSPFFHMIIQINSNFVNDLYCGSSINDVPPTLYDLVTVVMHELGHGLGILSDIDANGTPVHAPFVFLFDQIIFAPNAGDSPVTSPIVSDSAILTSGNVQFPSSPPVSLYAPPTFLYGVSISHTQNYGLMYYKGFRGQGWRTLNVDIVNVLARMGYSTIGCTAPDESSPCGNCLGGYSCYTSSSNYLHSFIEFLLEK